MHIIILLIYMAWAVYAGWKFVNGRFLFLEQEGTVYKVLKALCVIGIGSIYGGIYFVILILRFMNLMENLNDK